MPTTVLTIIVRMQAHTGKITASCHGTSRCCFFAHQLVLFVVPVLIRLMEYRVAASVPLTPHPPCLRGPGGLGHKATGSVEGGGRGACGERLRGS